MTVGDVPGASGLRGVLAARAFEAGEAVISLPTRLAVGLGLHTFTPQVSCSARVEYAELRVGRAHRPLARSGMGGRPAPAAWREHSSRQRR